MLVVAKYSKESAAFATEAEALADFTSAATEEQKDEFAQFEADALNSGLVTQPVTYEWTDGNTIIVVVNLGNFFTQSQLTTVLAREQTFSQAGWIKVFNQVDGIDVETRDSRHYVNGILVPVLPG